MKKKVLITGGAGFIGSHLADELLENGYEVRVLDNLSEQVHGKNVTRPDYLNDDVELVIGDVRDPKKVKEALKGIDAVYHYAAMVGVGQSMYEIKEYTDVNNMGTAVLLEALSKNPVEKLVVASSMSIYGEGLYKDSNGVIKAGVERTLEQLKTGDWEMYDANGNVLTPYPTPETKTPSLSSIYALSKYDQERMSLMIGKAYGIPTVALRFFNVYGTRQSLSNPYTGVLAIFASRLLNNNPVLIFEDGNQKRDFVSVLDIARASRLALETPEAAYDVFNIGSGNAYTINEIAGKMAEILGKEDILPDICGKYRVGDIRHCSSDISKAKQILGYEPRVTLEQGLIELAEWLEGQTAEDKVSEMRNELAVRGLTV
ncbi:SDR family NAD(P)-dependent oxidoreductase [Segetibacter sp. 3557_3]|uniref:SDR family NAD(P)-dependent oxidoreductase n=1 Tax=Segetibacter sp. 3557_3 TaxID=2547429 RepID=UPI00105866C3|nr:SDR family NAD(P)-dependent oxidoreductase [Segetibacter sp. 3557_3]TDH25248.1 SDR family NAD(P)-dependent oxidoreductase [Segetibacter sp. 3557_3]